MWATAVPKYWIFTTNLQFRKKLKFFTLDFFRNAKNKSLIYRYYFCHFQISFLIPPEAIPGRLGLLLTLFLCLVNTLNSVARETPKASGATTALADWIISCKVFVLAAILEYAVLLFMGRRASLRKKRTIAAAASDIERGMKPGLAAKKWSDQTLDKVAATILPVAFIAYSLIFWGVDRQQPSDNTSDVPPCF